tara:strand:- start:2805 stop:3005 length:201 start_codon:yes stop_codon:yes gene_type:complete
MTLDEFAYRIWHLSQTEPRVTTITQDDAISFANTVYPMYADAIESNEELVHILDKQCSLDSEMRVH